MEESEKDNLRILDSDLSNYKDEIRNYVKIIRQKVVFFQDYLPKKIEISQFIKLQVPKGSISVKKVPQMFKEYFNKQSSQRFPGHLFRWCLSKSSLRNESFKVKVRCGRSWEYTCSAYYIYNYDLSDECYYLQKCQNHHKHLPGYPWISEQVSIPYMMYTQYCKTEEGCKFVLVRLNNFVQSLKREGLMVASKRQNIEKSYRSSQNQNQKSLNQIEKNTIKKVKDQITACIKSIQERVALFEAQFPTKEQICNLLKINEISKANNKEIVQKLFYVLSIRKFPDQNISWLVKNQKNYKNEDVVMVKCYDSRSSYRCKAYITYVYNSRKNQYQLDKFRNFHRHAPSPEWILNIAGIPYNVYRFQNLREFQKTLEKVKNLALQISVMNSKKKISLFKKDQTAIADKINSD